MLYIKNTYTEQGKELVTDIFEWDVVNWSCALPLWQKALNSKKLSQGKAIEIGGRRGGLSLFAAIEGFDVTCTDLKSPEEDAHVLHSKYNVNDHISYAALDVCDWNESEKYDLILFKSVLGGVGMNDRKDRQELAISNMISALRPGGLILFAENLSGTRAHQFLRKRFTSWGSRWRYPSGEEFTSFFDPNAGEFLETRCFGMLGTFGRTEKQRKVLGRIDCGLVCKCVPDNWKYAMAGVWQKKS